jgi:hypothetical protein
MLGRSFLPEEDRPGQNQVTILSYRVWQEQFGADRDIAGRTITLNDNSYIVVGVLPADFRRAASLISGCLSLLIQRSSSAAPIRCVLSQG